MTEKIGHKLLTTKLLETADIQMLFVPHKPLMTGIGLTTKKFPLAKSHYSCSERSDNEDNLFFEL